MTFVLQFRPLALALPRCCGAVLWLAGLVLWIAACGGALAADDPPPEWVPSPSIATSLPQQGDPGGVRRHLGHRGVVYSVMYTNDVLANVDGGRKRGTIDQGKVEGTLSIDLGRLAGLDGWSFFSNSFQVYNTGRIRRDYVGGFNTIAAIEAVPGLRLSELWVERKLLDGTASIRFGQLAADVEFFYAGIAADFLQSDWASITALNLPSGGPAYPLATPGVRLKWEPRSGISLLLAAFNGDPAGPGPGDEQLRNRHGLDFRVRDPAFAIGELQFRSNQGKADTALASTLKLGAWGRPKAPDSFIPLAPGFVRVDPTGVGHVSRLIGSSGVYAVVEQQLYRPAGGGADSGVTLFSRISASPTDRSLSDFFIDAGLIVAGLVPGRPADKGGVSFMYTRFADFAQAPAGAEPTGAPLGKFEANLELSYSAQVVPGFNVVPLATYVWRPSGEAGRDAIVVGARSVVRY